MVNGYAGRWKAQEVIWVPKEGDGWLSKGYECLRRMAKQREGWLKRDWTGLERERSIRREIGDQGRWVA